MNLATARSLKRAKEVGLRKVVGAARGQLVRQFLGDSLVLTFLALLLAAGLVTAVLPAFRTFVEREIFFNPLRDAALMPALVLLAAVVGAVAGTIRRSSSRAPPRSPPSKGRGHREPKAGGYGMP